MERIELCRRIKLGVEYDFLSYTSFPSSVKLVNDTDEPAYVWPVIAVGVPVKPGGKITLECNGKQTGHFETGKITGVRTDLMINRVWTPGGFLFLAFPFGTFDWRKITSPRASEAIPEGATVMKVALYARGVKGDVTWFDDLKIFQDNVLIYSDDFSKWDPLIGAGVGAPIGGVAGYLLKEPLGPMVSEVVGAVVGGALGGGVGLLTGMGIIPVPQIPIPTLGAAPEGPGAPMRLGKYLITG